MKKSNIKIIAEAGVNHNGSINLALKLIDAASEAGADFVKFQHTNPENASSKAPLVDYQKAKRLKNQKSMIKDFHLNWSKAYPILIKRAKQKKIKFMQSFFSALDYIDSKKYNFDYIKIPSSDIINIPLLEAVGKDNKKIFLSTGMANLKEIKDAIKTLTRNGTKRSNIVIFHCVSSYPTPITKVNLNSILFLRKKLNLQVGLSDHTKDQFASALALNLGCNTFEKHFTLSKKLKGPDHKLSLDTNELRNFVFNLKNYYKAYGKYEKKCLDIEKQAREVTRQSVHAKEFIKKGVLFTRKNTMLKRPGNGVKPSYYKKLLKQKAKRNFKIDEAIKL